jgi:hypothetical protein
MNSQKRGGFGGGAPKRPRLNNDEDEGGTFEEHLASLMDEEMDMMEEMEDWTGASGSNEAEGPQQSSTSER